MTTATRPAPVVSAPVFALVLLITVAIFLNYIDRGAIGIAAPLMKSELGLSATRFGVAVSAFFWVYAPIQLLIGRMCDRLPVYRVYGAGVALWAASTMLTGFVGGMVSLVCLRVLLGIGESVAFPGSSKMIARHVPPERRGMANAAVGAALALGPAAGTLAGGLITASYGWRAMFLVFGLLTFLWLIPWAVVLRGLRPRRERTEEDCGPVSSVIRHFSLWAMAVGHFTNNYGLYFLLTWLPLFLVQQRGFSIVQMSSLATLSYVAQAMSALIMGWMSDRWCASGRPEAAIRRGMLVTCHLIFAVSIVGVLLGGTGGWLAAWLVLAGVGNGAGALNMYAIAQMFAGPRASGTWVGVQNGFGNVSGIVQPIVAGVIIDWSGSYAGAFWLAAGVSTFGALWWAFVLPEIAQIQLD
jgi:MFS family permease